jgi:hypothetical protein
MAALTQARSKDLEFAFRADATLGPAKGFVQFDDWLYHCTFTGTVRDVQVLAWALDGSPREVRITGVWADRPGTDCTWVIVAPGQIDQGQLSLAIRGNVIEDVPLAPITNGYITVTGM